MINVASGTRTKRQKARRLTFFDLEKKFSPHSQHMIEQLQQLVSIIPDQYQGIAAATLYRHF